MTDKTKIEWTDSTWNPITGCSVISPGCTNCYAMKLAGTRLKHHPSRKGLAKPSKAGPVWTGKVRLNEQWLEQPVRWKKPRMIFVCAHGDLFHESVPDRWIDMVFAVMALCPQHTFQVLTKRPGRMRDYINERWQATVERTVGDIHVPAGKPTGRRGPLPNVLLGTSIEDNKRALERHLPMYMLFISGWKTFVSYEPALGAINWTAWQFIDWLICGGESQSGARPMHPDWAREARDFCSDYKIPYFFKQWGEWTPGENVELQQGTVQTATWFGGDWMFGKENLARTDGHRDDEADLFRIGKKHTGRRLDGNTHNQFPDFSGGK